MGQGCERRRPEHRVLPQLQDPVGQLEHQYECLASQLRVQEAGTSREEADRAHHDANVHDECPLGRGKDVIGETTLTLYLTPSMEFTLATTSRFLLAASSPPPPGLFGRTSDRSSFRLYSLPSLRSSHLQPSSSAPTTLLARLPAW